VESFKRQALPQIEHSLLEEAQERFVERGKKQDLLRLNGKDRVRIKTLHGSFEFKEQRFVLADGSSCRYLRKTGQGRISCGLRELCLYYSNRLSFAEVGKLPKRRWLPSATCLTPRRPKCCCTVGSGSGNPNTVSLAGRR
jgi:hypothetical protein